MKKTCEECSKNTYAFEYIFFSLLQFLITLDTVPLVNQGMSSSSTSSVVQLKLPVCSMQFHFSITHSLLGSLLQFYSYP